MILDKIRATPMSNLWLKLCIPKTDVPAAIRSHLKTDVGEDEIENPDWPPAAIF